MTTLLSLRLLPDVKKRLVRFAKAEQRSLSFIAQEAITDYLDAKEWKEKQIAEALKNSFEETEFVSGEAVMKWLASSDKDKKRKLPKADIKRKKQA